MTEYDKILIGGLEATLKDRKALLRVLEIDGGIGEIKGEGSKTNLKFINGEGFDELFKSSSINEIVVSAGSGEVFRGLCKLVRVELEGRGYGFRGGDFEVRIIGNNAVWFEKLKGVSLKNLAWGEMVYETGNIVDGFLANPLTAKHGFVLGKWGKWANDDGGNGWYVGLDESTFVGFVKFIIEDGFKKIGYNVESQFLNSPFISIVMPFAMKVYDELFLKSRYDVECVIDKLKITTFTSGGVVILGNADGSGKNSSTSVFTEILNNPKNENGENLFRDLGRPSWYQQSPLIPPNAPNRFSYECVISGDYEIFLVNENYSQLNDYYLLNMDVFKNCPVNGLPQQGTLIGQINLNERAIISILAGDVIDFSFRINGPFANTLVFENMRWGIRWAREVGMSRKWLIGGLVPDWNVADILAGCVHAFSLKFETNETFKIVGFEPSDEWKDERTGVKEGFYKSFNGQGYNVDVRDKISSYRVKDRLILSERAEIEKRDVVKELRMSYQMDAVGSGVEDRLKAKILEGVFAFENSDTEGVESYDNPFFVSTYQIYDTRIKGTQSKVTPLIPFLGDYDYYDKEEEVEPVYSDVPRLLCFGGQRVFVSGEIKGGTVKMNGNNNYPLPSAWVVNYNDGDGTDLSLSFGDDFNLKGAKIGGLIRRFYLKDFLRKNRGDKYKMAIEWGIGRVRFRDTWDFEGKRFILKKVEGYDGRGVEVCKTYFEEDVLIVEGDLEKVKGVVVKSVGDVL